MKKNQVSYCFYEISIKSRMIPIVVAISTVFFALYAPSVCKQALSNGYMICTTQLLFALFPFLVAANLLIICNVAPVIGYPFRLLCRTLGFYEPCTAAIFAIALLGGFAPAISALSQSVALGHINKQQASRLLPLICFLGPSYIILAIGEGMLGNLLVGIYLFLSQLLASIFCTFILYAFSHLKSANNASTQFKQDKAANKTTDSWNMSHTIHESFFAFLRLCSVILYFQFLSAGACTLLPTSLHWICQSLLEVTTACVTICTTGINASVRCCIALSVLSISILLQASALCHKDISLHSLLISRFLHLPISLLCFKAFLQIPQTQAIYNSLSARVLPIQRLPLDQWLLLFIACVFLIDRLQKSTL